MSSIAQREKVRVCSALAYAAILLAGALLVLAPGTYRFEKKTSHPRVSVIGAQGTGGAATDKAEPAVRARAMESYGKLPLSFEANRGQTDRRVRFFSRGSGYSLFLTGDEAVLALKNNLRSRKPVAAAFRTAHQDRADRGSADLLFGSATFPAVLLRTTGEFQEGFAPRDAAEIPDPETQAPAVLRMKLAGANPHAQVRGFEELPGKSNYFIGNDPRKWRTNVPNYAKVKYANVYPGVDLVYYGNQGKLEYDFVVQPGGDPSSIQLAINSDEPVGSPLRIDANGDLVVGTEGGEVIFRKPILYQPGGNYKPGTKNREARRKDDERIEGHYVLNGNRVTFQVAGYDKTRPIVIDPTLAYSTYLGGSIGDGGHSVAADAFGNAYVTGTTDSSNFPTTPGAFQTTFGGGFRNAFVTKLKDDGSALVYSTYLGGNGASGDAGFAIAVDASGNAYVSGEASPNFPTTPGAFQTAYGSNGGCSPACPHGFVAKLNAAGSALLYSTYLSGTNDFDRVEGMAVDASGNAYVTGVTLSSNFPTTAGAFQTIFGGEIDAFVTKLNAAGSALLYSTYLAGSKNDFGSGIAVDASGNAFVTGATHSGDFPITPDAFQTFLAGFTNVFVTKLNATGSALIYSTFLGGSKDDFGNGIAVDTSGNAYVTGSTDSSNFPTTPGAFQTTLLGTTNVFVSKLNATGSALLYSTFLGGSGTLFGDFGFNIALDASGNAYVTGSTDSSNFPTTPDAFQKSIVGVVGVKNAFVSKLNAAGSALIYSTYLGGSGGDVGSGIAVDASTNAYVAGSTDSSNFPTTPGAFQTSFGGSGDAFLAKISFALELLPSSLNFAPQAVGTTSPAQPATLKNTGSAPLTITSITTSGDFAQTNDCGSTVKAGASCTIEVTFTPTAAGTRNGAVTITDDAVGSPHHVSLTGTGGIPAVSLTPSSLTFASQAVGTTSPAQPATLKNTGDGPLTITNITTSGDFAQTNDCGSTVNQGASCTLSVTFTPTATGTRTGTLTITDDAAGSPHMVSLTGTGFNGGPVVSLTPGLAFGAQPVGTFSAALVATLKNTGGGALKIVGIGRSGDFYEGNNCPTTLAASASCTLRVIFTPTSPGTRLGAVTISDNAPGSPHKLPLSGTGSGTGSIILRLSPGSLSFGSVAVGSTSSAQTVTLTNIGTVAASFLDPFGFATGGTDGKDFVKDPHCGTSLGPGKSCTVTLTFKPLATGTRTGFFLVRQGAASVQIPLSGTGIL